MKGLIVLFLSLSAFGIGWGYLDAEGREWFKGVVRKNLLPLLLAFAAVSLAIVLSTNTTLRLV